MAVTRGLYSHDQDASTNGHGNMSKDPYIVQRVCRLLLADGYKFGYEDENGGVEASQTKNRKGKAGPGSTYAK